MLFLTKILCLIIYPRLFLYSDFKFTSFDRLDSIATLEIAMDGTDRSN